MKASLQLDPSVDIVGNRLPNVWVKSRQAGEHIFTEQIARLARDLDPRGALVIFPEGGNWTPGRWRRGIRRLENLGRKDLAKRAAHMPNLLPPRPGGALAAIEACPGADVIFVAHAGLDNIISLGDIWARFPIHQVVRARWWRVPHDQVPRTASHEAQLQWLYAWWERIDEWISENRPEGSPAPAPATAQRTGTPTRSAHDRAAGTCGTGAGPGGVVLGDQAVLGELPVVPSARPQQLEERLVRGEAHQAPVERHGQHGPHGPVQSPLHAAGHQAVDISKLPMIMVASTPRTGLGGEQRLD